MKRKRILIVEDSRIVAVDLQNILEGLGYEVAGIAGDGREAIEGCAEAVPDLVLMDVRLPGDLDGIQASREIRKLVNVPIVYTTAYSDRETVDEIQRSFPFGFIIKPYREKDLLVAVETAFTRFEYEKKLEASERRYRSLFEGSGDIVFTMDEGWNILSVNWAVMNHLNMRPDDVIGLNFLGFIHVSQGRDFTSEKLVREKLEFFSRNRRPIGFRASFRSNFNDEPVEMSVRLEYVAEGEGSIVMGRAFRVVEDELLKFFIEERQSLVMGNQLFLVSDIAYRITRNLRRYLDQDATELVRMALVEMIVNAIEHGNLEITFEEKTEAMRTGDYVNFITRRQCDPHCRDRTVRVEYEIGPAGTTYTIEDDGKGFDHSVFLEKDMGDVNQELHPHGRGILMSKKIFDQVSFNDRGNRVTLVKRFA